MSKKKNQINQIETQISELQLKKEHLEKIIKNKRKIDERKQRARRLIETGALAEKYFDIELLTIPEREELFKMFSYFIKANTPKKFKKNKPEN